VNLSESVSLTDSIAKSAGVNLSESVSLTDSISKTAGVNLSESVSLTDSISVSKVYSESGVIWGVDRIFTLNSNQIYGEPHTDFPVLFTLDNDSALKLSDVQSDGGDIRFTSDGTTLLSYEIEYFNKADGDLIAWVKYPSLSGDATNLLHLHYEADQTISHDGVILRDTWDDIYKSVLHLNQTSTSTKGAYADASYNGTVTANDAGVKNEDNNFGTGGGLTASKAPTATSVTEGRIGVAADFDGTDDFICIDTRDGDCVSDENPAYDAEIDQRTISFWFSPDTLPEGGVSVLYEEGGTVNGLNMYINGTKFFGGAWAGSYGWSGDWVTSSKSLEVGSWYFAAMVFDNPASGDKTLKIYLDGELEGTISVETDIAPNHSDDDGLGAIISDSKVQTGDIGNSGSEQTNFFDGKMDEFRVTDTARDSDWLKTRYHSELGGATFIFVDTIASQETLGLTDSVTVTVTKPQAISESISFTDSISKTSSVNLTESITLADSISKTADVNLSDTVLLTDSISKTAGVNLSDTVLLTDSISKAAGVNLSDTVLLTESISKTAGVNLSDTVSLTDSISKTAGVNLTESVSLTDSIAKAAGVNLSESISFTDSISKTAGVNLSQTVSLTESKTKSAGVKLSESVCLTDSIA